MNGQENNTANNKQLYVYFCVSDWNIIHLIQDRFNLPKCVTINGETCQPCDIKAEDMELLRETEKRGFIQIRYKDK